MKTQTYRSELIEALQFAEILPEAGETDSIPLAQLECQAVEHDLVTYYIRRPNGERYQIGGGIIPFASRKDAEECNAAADLEGEIEADFV